MSQPLNSGGSPAPWFRIFGVEWWSVLWRNLTVQSQRNWTYPACRVGIFKKVISFKSGCRLNTAKVFRSKAAPNHSGTGGLFSASAKTPVLNNGYMPWRFRWWVQVWFPLDFLCRSDRKSPANPPLHIARTVMHKREILNRLIWKNKNLINQTNLPKKH